MATPFEIYHMCGSKVPKVENLDLDELEQIAHKINPQYGMDERYSSLIEKDPTLESKFEELIAKLKEQFHIRVRKACEQLLLDNDWMNDLPTSLYEEAQEQWEQEYFEVLATLLASRQGFKNGRNRPTEEDYQYVFDGVLCNLDS